MQVLPAIFIASSAICRAESFVWRMQRGGGGKRERPAGADGGDVFIRLDHVAVAAQDESILHVRHQQQRFQMAQDFVRAPVLRQFHHGARQIAVELLQLGFKTREERKSVGGRPGKSRQDLVVVEPAQLFAPWISVLRCPSVTWPSPAITTFPSRRTQSTVVERIRCFICIEISV